MRDYTIISVGGSIIIPKTGFDPIFLQNFRALIRREVRKGRRFILTIGGGATARQYLQALEAVIPTTPDMLDWLGIKTTIFNAEFVKMLFGSDAYPEIITNPTKKVKTNKPIIIAAGWKPGRSTDTVATILAKTFGARMIYNLSNIDYVYDSDPAENPVAQRFETISWPAYQAIVGPTWTPGMSAPFDPVATVLARRLKLKVLFLKGFDLENVKKAFAGKRFQGTVMG
jgi:uridylate kinase